MHFQLRTKIMFAEHCAQMDVWTTLWCTVCDWCAPSSLRLQTLGVNRRPWLAFGVCSPLLLHSAFTRRSANAAPKRTAAIKSAAVVVR